ncbi:MAG TPA: dienelactone hydrolase family protein [Ramlibacter sp.]|uniref:alpha/beta hydrolase family protein n=1 Tax=Ramlibacter sp. TaxID=1917967 RepID=UPI002D80D39A|nr:dienelactone hydrolase family protein [Ramlibacter sp.]HET8744982.1 dienelactone hydrolase family protein [Ramlibacter sp.]
MHNIRLLLAAVLSAAAFSAQAGLGLATLPGVQGDNPVTVFYPTLQADRPVQRGPFTLAAAEDAPPERGNGRLVVISHGSGGNAWVHTDLARTLVEAGFVVAVPLHRGDNALDPREPGPESWKRRPAEASRAIDAVVQAPRFAGLVDAGRVGVYGMSAGGLTALTFAGGRWSPSQFVRHCEAHIGDDFPFCVGLLTALKGNALDEVKKKAALLVIRRRFDDPAWIAHHDARVQAVVSGVPAAAVFDPASLATPRVPLALVTARQDKWLAPALHSDVILKACAPRCALLADLPTGGHGALLSPPPPPERLGEIAADLLGDPPGFDRAQLPAVDRAIAAFFTRHLLP